MENRLYLTLRTRVLTSDEVNLRSWQTVEEKKILPAHKVGIIVCDVWDRHWCRGAQERLKMLLPRMNKTLRALRGRDAHIIHAPSDTMDFYAENPARLRILEAPPVTPPVNQFHEEPALPVDASDGGCDSEDNPGMVNEHLWSRQHPMIDIDEKKDTISDNGREIYSYMKAQGIEHVVIMGVHTNMCILNRSFAIKQMVRWGVDIMLCRDLTDCMYNPAKPPYVSHDEGLALIVAHIEAFWCPTVSSNELISNG